MAATPTGLMSGITGHRHAVADHPAIDVVRGIASAGVGLATANIAGKTLLALAGLTPVKAAGHGFVGRMMHAVLPPMFGIR
jgi:hypothetical protein